MVNKKNKELVKKALADGPEWNPAKGFIFIENVNIGKLVSTDSGLKAIVTEHTASSTSVLVLDASFAPDTEKNFFLGNQRWDNKTEVKIIGEKNAK